MRYSAVPHALFSISAVAKDGWFVNSSANNVGVVGVDVVPALVEAADRVGVGDFLAMSYEEIAAGELEISVDVIVCNFSLLGKESVEGGFRVAPSLLDRDGSFIVQTLHPVIACGDLPYWEGWREGQ